MDIDPATLGTFDASTLIALTASINTICNQVSGLCGLCK